MKRTLCYAALSLAMLSITGCSNQCDCSDQKLFESTLNPTPPNQLDQEMAKRSLAFISEKSAVLDDEFEDESDFIQPEQEIQPSSAPESQTIAVTNDSLPTPQPLTYAATLARSAATPVLSAAQPFVTAASMAAQPNLQRDKRSLSSDGRTLRSTKEPPQTFPRPKPTLASHFISIMGQDGVVLTAWALAKRNWLWAYAPMDSQSFGNIRNWRIERSFRRENFRFVNQWLGTCMQAYGNGLIHDTCDKRNLDQDFDLMPTSTGSVFIKSVSQQRCVTYDPVNTHGYDTITLAPCDDNITPLRDQNWYLAPPLLPAIPDIAAENE